MRALAAYAARWPDETGREDLLPEIPLVNGLAEYRLVDVLKIGQRELPRQEAPRDVAVAQFRAHAPEGRSEHVVVVVREPPRILHRAPCDLRILRRCAQPRSVIGHERIPRDADDAAERIAVGIIERH